MVGESARSRIVVTGMGWVTPLGHSIEPTWSAMLAGKSATAPTSLFDASTFPTTFAAEVKDFDLRQEVPHADRFVNAGRCTHFVLSAAWQAWRQSRLDRSDVDGRRIGLYLANGEGPLDFEAFTRCCIAAWDNEQRRVDTVRWSQRALLELDAVREREQNPNSGLRHLAALVGARGPSFNTITACAASTQAIGEAVEILCCGDADIMLAGGANSMIHPFGVTGFNRLTALSTRNESPETASRPFDLDRDGFVIGEGAGIVVLETLEHAQRRGAPILAELAGSGNAADAYRVTDQHPQARGAVHAMKRALESAGVTPAEIDYINAHGTSTKENDQQETAAIQQVFGSHAQNIPVSSLKSMIGHLITAAGVVELIASILTIRDGIIPPTINLHTPDPQCDLDYVPHVSRRSKVDVVLSNNAGFGGQNSAIVVRRFEDSIRGVRRPANKPRRRVVVTGLGVVSPFGVGIDLFQKGLAEGRCALGPISRFDASGFRCRIAGEVPAFRFADFLPTFYRKAAKLMARDIVLTVVAAEEAMRSAKLPSSASLIESEQVDDRFSCHVGAEVICAELDELVPALHHSRNGTELDLKQWGLEGMKQLTPLSLLKYLPNMLASHLTIIHRLTATSNTITADEVSGHLAIGEAFRTIQRGDADRALCGGAASQVHPLNMARWSLTNRLNQAANASPASAVAPFNDDVQGTVLGEGGGFLVIESLESALNRGAFIHAEVGGFGSSQEVEAPAAIDSNGSYRHAISGALSESRLTGQEIDLLIPGGIGIAEDDRFEWNELRHSLGERLKDIPLCLPKRHTGNLVAGNAVDLVAAVLAVDREHAPRFASQGESPENVLCCSTNGCGQSAALIIRKFRH